MEPPPPVCASCGAPLRAAGKRCRACRAWPPEAAWDRALYLGLGTLTALVMGVRWWIRTTERPLDMDAIWRAWLHPVVLVPLALTGVYGVRLLRRS